jgi:DNA invertase Pin-like site-specific DNA recombinase
MVAHVLVVVAEWERRTIGERTKSAMAAMRAAGQTTGRAAIADNPELNARIHELHDENRSLSEIARILNQEGWPTVRGGSEWRHSAVQNALGYQRPPRRRRRAELPVIPRRRRIAA